MIVDIRGGLGTQVLELMGQYALAIERGQTITGIRINGGGGIEESRYSYVGYIFQNLPPVTHVDGVAKLGIFKDWSIFRLILKHRERILHQIGSLRSFGAIRCDRLLHVRTGDYEFVSMERYIEFARGRHGLACIGNNDAHINVVPGSNVSTGSAAGDWFTCLYARELFTSATTFTISTLFVDPTKRVSMWAKQDGEVFAKTLGPLMRELPGAFPNFKLI